MNLSYNLIGLLLIDTRPTWSKRNRFQKTVAGQAGQDGTAGGAGPAGAAGAAGAGGSGICIWPSIQK